MKRLNLALLQPDTVWEDRDANLRKLEQWITRRINAADLILLPEMFSTGFTMEPDKFREPCSSLELEWMKSMSAKTGAALVGSFIHHGNRRYPFNRLAFVEPEGKVAYYDKRHLFRMGEEDRHYSAGNSILDVRFRDWMIKPLICYDLRFPVWIRTGKRSDLLIFVANWPEPRREVWITLLKARAIENQAYVAGVNRVGVDGRNLKYTGDSMVIGPRGDVLASAAQGAEDVVSVEIDLQALTDFREKFPVHLDADRFQIEI